ncbi:MAG: DUF4124 domain-containing protein [Gammaproteobacteria bacterium]|nr:DUF4124 domain-containing protein [Gammaproteobacteria bacterium]
MLLARFVGITFILFSVLPVHAALNKWVDDKGQVHYGDRVPAEYLKKERAVLNEQGVIVRETKAAKTKEELLAEKKEKAREMEIKRQKLIEEKKKALRDRVLLDTFTTEKDIMLARDARIDAVDSQINLSETLIKNDEQKLKDVKQRIESIEKSGRQVPENLHKEVTAVSRQLENHYQFVETKTEEREQILRGFEQDIKRFRELQKKRKEEAELRRLEQQQRLD